MRRKGGGGEGGGGEGSSSSCLSSAMLGIRYLTRNLHSTMFQNEEGRGDRQINTHTLQLIERTSLGVGLLKLIY